MTQYIVRRLLQMIPITLGILTLIFSLIHLIPGDPAMQQLDNWETFESENPDTFTNMYEFWVQTS